MTSSPRLPFDEPEPDEPVSGELGSSGDAQVNERIDARDREARQRAVDPRYHVALEASAGTGKTRVLVDRYLNLLKSGVDPANILAITFTRKAATEMRQRIVQALSAAAERGEIPPSRWRELRDRLADVGVSTIDAFCLSLLREFPLEADLDPGFAMADETEVPRLIDEALDRALRICRGLAADDEHVALVFAQLGDRRVRVGLAALLNRRIVAPALLERHLAKGPRDWDVAVVSARGARALADVFSAMPGGLDRFVETGPLEPSFRLLVRQMRRLVRDVDGSQAAVAARAGAESEPEPGAQPEPRAIPAAGDRNPAAVRSAFERAREYFLTQDGQPRARTVHAKGAFASERDWRQHRELVVGHAPALVQAYLGYRRELNVLVSRGVWRMYRVAESEYRKTLDAHAALDFSDILLHALRLLRQMEEFAQSRYRLESRYHHLLVDEFQDTSRAQWELVSLLIQAWGAGAGLAHAGPLPPTIFIVGDRKQSIYAFRDADVSVMHEARAHLGRLRDDGDVHRSISRSFRSVPALLSFVNDVCADLEKVPTRRDAFLYADEDRFPLDELSPPDEPALGLVVGPTPEACAEITAAEILRLLTTAATVRDRDTGIRRAIRPGDVAILFRTRESHREFEEALARRGVPSYVYKGLGFFDADEVKDVLALLWYLAEPLSDLRTAAWLRSRFVRLSDEGLRRLAPGLADAVNTESAVPPGESLDADDARVLAAARAAARRWRTLVDRMPPAELLDVVLRETAYAFELRGPRRLQARENLKKLRGLVRRIQNRGYTTLGRIVAHIDRLAVGDEANAAIDATDSVNLMTVHAAKGLEFPVVFVVNLSRGTGGRRDPIRVGTDADGLEASVAVGDYLSEADEDEAARGREETKRLLYVAFTRARDRLYLGTALRDGRLLPGRGSLGEVCPPSLLGVLAQAGIAEAGSAQAGMAVTGAGTGAAGVQWQAASGAIHHFHLCESSEPRDGGDDVSRGGAVTRDSRAASDSPTVSETAASETAANDDLAPLEAQPGPVTSVTAAAADEQQAPSAGTAPPSERLLGTLVHRLVQACGLGETNDERLLSTASGLLTPSETVDLDDRDGWLARAVRLYRALTVRPEVVALLNAREIRYEVPFSLLDGERLVRGTIDCLVVDELGQLTILEFKTGRPRPEHQSQAELYRQAAEAIFPGLRVVATVVYAGS
jgi:ATP-dependent helicase/nuclease subunit A